MFRQKVEIRDNSGIKVVRIFNFLSKKTKFKSFKAGSFFFASVFKTKKKILKKKLVKIVIVAQSHFLQKLDGSSVKAKSAVATFLAKNTKRRYEKLGFFFNTYSTKKFYKKYKNVI